MSDTLLDELSAIKDVEDTVVGNKVANFAYDDYAYEHNDANGVDTYNVNNHQNIPNGTASIMKVNSTILTKGWRAQASAITRMAMNHFLGRISYNLNKLHDNFSGMLNNLVSYIGQPDGLATLDSEGHLVEQSPVGSPFVTITRGLLGVMCGELLGRTWKLIEGISVTGCPYFANGLWVYAGLWSTDGINWEQGTNIYNVLNVHYANNLWVAVGVNKVWWSENGKDWTEGAVTSGAGFSRVTEVSYANGIWVIAGSTQQGGGVSTLGSWWSEDGKNWTQGTGVGTAGTWFDSMYYAEGLWVACREGYTSGQNSVYWSEDGKTWSEGTGSIPYPKKVYHESENNRWLVTGRNCIWWSEDGKNWTQGTGISTESDNLINDVRYANGLYVAGGQGNPLWSKNGKSWTQGTGIESYYMTAVIYYANGVWYAGSSNPANTFGLKWSVNGKDWENSDVLNGSVDRICYAEGVILANYSGRKLIRSSIDDLIANGTIDLGADIPIVNA